MPDLTRQLPSGRSARIRSAAAGGFELLLDDAVQSSVHSDPARLTDEYQQRFASAFDARGGAHAPRVAHFGAGALTFARYVSSRHPRAMHTVVEREVGLVDFVADALPSSAFDALEQIIADAAAAAGILAAEVGSGKRAPYDAVIWDVYLGDDAPGGPAAATLADLSRLLSPADSVLLMNIAGGDSRAARETARAAAVLGSCVLIGSPDVLADQRSGNVVLAAGPCAESAEWRDRVRQRGPHPLQLDIVAAQRER